MIELPAGNGRPHDTVVALWLTRVETNGNGGLREIPVRRLTPAEERRIKASIAAHAPDPQPYEQAAPIDGLEEQIVALIERDGRTTRAGVVDATGATPSQAYKALVRLRRARRVRLTGRGPSTRYVAADD